MRLPFDLDDDASYQRWREDKLANAPSRIEDLMVEIRDPRALTDAEHAALMDRCRRANMAIYVGQTGDDPDKGIPIQLGASFGLHRLDHNRGADADAVTSLTVQSDAAHRDFIPYSNRPIAWHTDGYYNPPARQIHGLILHCVQPAESGGANALLDHEIVYILLRDRSPEAVAALMQPDCMTIPAHRVDGVELRPEQGGPVFAVRPDGRLHMRYTARGRNVIWRDDARTEAAVAALTAILLTPSPWHVEGRLEAGWGLLSNNVLHTRSGFTDGVKPRLLYRARYYDRIQGT
jgi:hypothetical protein